MNKVLGYDAAYHYQGNLDYDALKAKGGVFIITKAGEGWLDYRAYHYVESAKQAGMITGTYWYYRQTVTISGKTVWCDPKIQAQEYWKATKGVFDLPPAVDIELAGNPSFNADDILTCLQEIEKIFGRKPMIYTGKYIWQNNVGSPAWSDNYDLWLAQYRSTEYIELPKPFTKWKIHQFSSSIIVSGKKIDHNYFNGNLKELIAYANAEAPEPIPSPIPSPKEDILILVNQLWGRSEPVFDARTHSVIVRKDELYDKAGDKYYEVVSNIMWQPIKIPERIVYVSAGKKYTQAINSGEDIKILVSQLWGRSKPIFNSLTHSVIVRKDEVYDKAGEKVHEPASGITWQPVKIPKRIVYVSANEKYVKET